MNDFHDCEFRYIDDDGSICCQNKHGINLNFDCDNCEENIHLNCNNYNPKKDMCLKWFETDVSKHSNECSEKTRFNDHELSRKWSN